MSLIKFRPIILAGGSGKRLWPLSTKEKPKQLPIIRATTKTKKQNRKQNKQGGGGKT